MMSLWDALRMNMMISYQELVRTFPNNSRRCSTVNDSANDCAEKANGAINKMAEVIRFRLNIISLYGAKKELTHRIQTVLNATIIKVL